MFFSVIIPVYNRPLELAELLQSLSIQNYRDFEVIVIEDGSSLSSEGVIHDFQNQIEITYIAQSNQGQGFARNNGMKHAKGDFFIVLDSDVILPETYLDQVFMGIKRNHLDAFGGPDGAESTFTAQQKAMDFAMTSFWTTGGIRGKLKNPASFQARGFNMGVSRRVFEETQGFLDPNRGEDIEWSIRIKKAGFKIELIEEAIVFHKRKNTLSSFAKQAFSFGRNRVNVSRFHPEAIKVVHLLPSAFTCFILAMVPAAIFFPNLFLLQTGVFCLWLTLVFLSSIIRYHSIRVALLSLITSITQLFCYGIGLIAELVIKSFKG